MVETNWSLQTLSDVFLRYHSQYGSPCLGLKPSVALKKAEGEWAAAIAALEELLLTIREDQKISQYQGIVLSGSGPILSNASLVSQFLMGVFTVDSFAKLSFSHFQLPGSAQTPPQLILELPLLPGDPIADEKFCLLFTSQFSVILLLGQDYQGLPAFHFSFEPDLIAQIWATLRSRLILTNFQDLDGLEKAINSYQSSEVDYKFVSKFTRKLLENLPINNSTESPKNNTQTSRELELLQALTHEIRTPLTAIRTWTKLLLKRSNLAPEVVKGLEMIDQECTEQINRMELIFRATELQSQALMQPVPLTSIALDQFFQQNLPNWQKQANRRNVKLEVILPKNLPTVQSDPAMLKQVLTGLIEKCSKNLTAGGHIQLEVMTVGNQLKLQFLSSQTITSNPLKSLGQVLMFQPETGSLTLNFDVTKNFFQLMGGKFIVRQQPKQGEVLTIFLPLQSPS